MKLMRLFPIVLVVFILAVLSSCKDDDPKYTSAEGKWSYTTPDSKVGIKFEIVKNSSGAFEVQGKTLTIDGVETVPVTIASGISLPIIASMRFSANDAKLVQPYSIKFTDSAVSGDFSKITVTSVEYTFPWGTTKTLTSITISRQ